MTFTTKGLESYCVKGRFYSVAILFSGAAVVIILAWLSVYGANFRPWLFQSHYIVHFPDLNARINQMWALDHLGLLYTPFATEAFMYPPPAIFLFWPLNLISKTSGFFLWTLFTILCLTITYYVAFTYSGFRRGTLALGVSFWSSAITVMIFPPMIECLAWGQTSTILIALLAADFLAIEGRRKGILTGIAAAIKLYPGIFIIFFGFQRKWRAAGTALTSFLLLVAASWILWPRQSTTFFFKRLLNGSEVTHFESYSAFSGTYESASIWSFLKRLTFLPSSLAFFLLIACSIAVLTIGLIASVRLYRASWKISSLVTLLFVTSLLSPVSWDHYFTFTPLLLFAAVEVGRKTRFGYSALATFTVFLIPWYFFRAPVTDPTTSFTIQDIWITILTFVARNAYIFASTFFIGAAWFETRQNREMNSTQSRPVDLGWRQRLPLQFLPKGMAEPAGGSINS